jgi:phosphatidylserine/phosphatidylglycerophosphate/cardiolipin synthase-like enzyme
VLTQLFAEAKSDAIIAAPYLQEGHGLSSGPLGDALLGALSRGINVDIMTTSRGLASLERDQLAQAARGRLRFYRPIANIRDEKQLGSHAKFCLVDGQRAYVGSANLTRPGLTEHVEMGLFVTGAPARQINAFWDCCVQIGLFVEVDARAQP